MNHKHYLFNMRFFVFLLATSAALKPYDMAQRICATRSDAVDNVQCLQDTFDALAYAESRALIAERNSHVKAGDIVSTTSALVNAFNQVMTALETNYNSTAHSKRCFLF